jgi:hypothetical protein
LSDLFDKLKCKNFKGIIHKFCESDFGIYVYTGINNLRNKSIMVGRLVQVRVGSGIGGSDVVLLRHCNNKLSSHENQCFVRITNYEDWDMVNNAFKISEVYNDSYNEEYSISGHNPATGFLVYDSLKSKYLI